MARHCAWRHLHICIFIHSWNFWWGRRSRCSFNLFQYFIEHTFVGKITFNKILFNAGCSTCIRMTLEGIFVQSKFTKSKNEKAWILKQQQQRGLNTWPNETSWDHIKTTRLIAAGWLQHPGKKKSKDITKNNHCQDLIPLTLTSWGESGSFSTGLATALVSTLRWGHQPSPHASGEEQTTDHKLVLTIA